MKNIKHGQLVALARVLKSYSVNNDLNEFVVSHDKYLGSILENC